MGITRTELEDELVFLVFTALACLYSSSLRKKYGKLYSVRAGSFKVVFVEDSSAVHEVLVKRSADYAGRPPFFSYLQYTAGM